MNNNHEGYNRKDYNNINNMLKTIENNYSKKNENVLGLNIPRDNREIYDNNKNMNSSVLSRDINLLTEFNNTRPINRINDNNTRIINKSNNNDDINNRLNNRELLPRSTTFTNSGLNNIPVFEDLPIFTRTVSKK